MTQLKKLRVCVAEDEADMAEFLEFALARAGHSVVSIVKTGSELVEAVARDQPDIVVTDIRMAEMDGLEAAKEIYSIRPLPIIVVSAFSDEEIVERAKDAHVIAYLVKPVKEADLGPAITVAMHRFAEFEALRCEARDLRQALEDRKVIERAKGLLMKSLGLDEPAAFARLQKLASSKQMKLVELARNIVLASEAFERD